MEIHFQTTDHVVAVEKVAEQHIGTKTNNKRDIGTFKFGHRHLTLNEAPRSNLTTSKDSQHMFSYRLFSHPKPVGSIISEIWALLSLATAV